jgi:hypothetical protein
MLTHYLAGWLDNVVLTLSTPSTFSIPANKYPFYGCIIPVLSLGKQSHPPITLFKDQYQICVLNRSSSECAFLASLLKKSNQNIT